MKISFRYQNKTNVNQKHIRTTGEREEKNTKRQPIHTIFANSSKNQQQQLQ